MTSAKAPCTCEICVVRKQQPVKHVLCSASLQNAIPGEGRVPACYVVHHAGGGNHEYAGRAPPHGQAEAGPVRPSPPLHCHRSPHPIPTHPIPPHPTLPARSALRHQHSLSYLLSSYISLWLMHTEMFLLRFIALTCRLLCHSNEKCVSSHAQLPCSISDHLVAIWITRLLGAAQQTSLSAA